MSEIDFTMTSVLRPALYDNTLSTIHRNVIVPNRDKHSFRLILNVDPVGEKVYPEDMVDVARKYFDNITYNIPTKPSFPVAVKWLWSEATAPYVFHWEDDVSIYRPIDLSNMVDIMNKYKDLAALRLFIHQTQRSKIINVFGSVWDYKKEGFYLARNNTAQFGLNPNFVKLAFVKEAAPLFDINRNPEKQFRLGGSMENLIVKWKFGLYTRPGDPYLVKGLEGAAWKRKYGFAKDKVAFTEWKEVK